MVVQASEHSVVATYRVTDPIENLELRVTLRKRGTFGQRRVRNTSEAPSKPRGLRDRLPRRRARGDATQTEEAGDEDIVIDKGVNAIKQMKRDFRSK